MKQKKLPQRLRVIADLINDGARVADIGTDHGYLPIYLAHTGIACRIIASDISKGSLESARNNAAKYKLTDKIEFICAPGLDRIGQDDVDTIVIAGIGGENIVNILTCAPWTVNACKKGGLKLIIQPQTKLDVLRKFLHNSGYVINNEIKVTDRNREYVILLVKM